jgi:hypothetical protein
VTALPESRIGATRPDPAMFAGLALSAGGAGLVLGENQHGEFVTLRLFRPEPTRAVVAGDLRFAQILVFRALALGASAVIQTGRPGAWGAFGRIGGAQGSVRVVPPGVVSGEPASAARPRLVILDAGLAAGADATGQPWTATMSVREELTAWDIDVLGGADLVLMQPLPAPEAELAASVLGLGDVRHSLSGIRADMATVVSRGTVRWAVIAPTAIERQLIGVPFGPG